MNPKTSWHPDLCGGREAMERKKRILLSKIGLDGHDRGIKILAKKMSDAGVEVVYLGLFQTVESVVSTAVQEDVDYIGISILDGGQTLIAEDLMESLRSNNLYNIKVIFGGIIPDRDKPILKKIGVNAVFGPGTPIEKIIDTVNGD